MMEQAMSANIFLAFISGLLSFLSPCVLPLVPGYLSFLAGYHEEEEGKRRRRSYIILQSCCFVAGFSFVFICLGMAAAGLVSGFLLKYQTLFAQISGGIIILLGIHTLGIFKSSLLMRDIRPHWHRSQVGMITSTVAGLAFGLGWTPCIGPVLAMILTLAAQSESASHGAFLLFLYAAGLGIPFILAAFAMEQFQHFNQKLRRYLGIIEKISGIFLILTGILICTQSTSLLSTFLLNAFPFLSRLG